MHAGNITCSFQAGPCRLYIRARPYRLYSTQVNYRLEYQTMSCRLDTTSTGCVVLYSLVTTLYVTTSLLLLPAAHSTSSVEPLDPYHLDLPAIMRQPRLFYWPLDNYFLSLDHNPRRTPRDTKNTMACIVAYTSRRGLEALERVANQRLQELKRKITSPWDCNKIGEKVGKTAFAANKTSMQRRRKRSFA